MPDILEGNTGCKHHHPFFDEECKWCIMTDIHVKRKQYKDVMDHNKKIEERSED